MEESTHKTQGSWCRSPRGRGESTRPRAGGAGVLARYAAVLGLMLTLSACAGQSMASDDAMALQRGCEAEDVEACLELAYAHWTGGVTGWVAGKRGTDTFVRAMTLDPVRAEALSRESCESGGAKGCLYLSFMYYFGLGVVADLEESATLLKGACADGIPQACVELGTRYAAGEGVPQNDPRAAELYREACKAGTAMGCDLLARAHVDGIGVEADRPAAIHLYQRACEMGSSFACDRLGLHHERGDCASSSFSEALRLYERACDGGYHVPCLRLAWIYRTWERVPQDEHEAAKWKRRACELGDSGSCEGGMPSDDPPSKER